MKDYSDLKNKTVFDICDVEELLEEVLPYVPDGYDRDQYLKDYWAQYPAHKAFSFLDLAELTNDDELAKATNAQFAKELAKYFNE